MQKLCLRRLQCRWEGYIIHFTRPERKGAMIVFSSRNQHLFAFVKGGRYGTNTVENQTFVSHRITLKANLDGETNLKIKSCVGILSESVRLFSFLMFFFWFIHVYSRYSHEIWSNLIACLSMKSDQVTPGASCRIDSSCQGLAQSYLCRGPRCWELPRKSVSAVDPCGCSLFSRQWREWRRPTTFGPGPELQLSGFRNEFSHILPSLWTPSASSKDRLVLPTIWYAK